jgi:hypothetical protein
MQRHALRHGQDRAFQSKETDHQGIGQGLASCQKRLVIRESGHGRWDSQRYRTSKQIAYRKRTKRREENMGLLFLIMGREF